MWIDAGLKLEKNQNMIMNLIKDGFNISGFPTLEEAKNDVTELKEK